MKIIWFLIFAIRDQMTKEEFSVNSFWYGCICFCNQSKRIYQIWLNITCIFFVIFCNQRKFSIMYLASFILRVQRFLCGFALSFMFVNFGLIFLFAEYGYFFANGTDILLFSFRLVNISVIFCSWFFFEKL